MKNSLENNIKAALENYQAEYNPADWTEMEKKLNSGEKLVKIFKGLIYALITISLSGIAFYFISENENEKTENPDRVKFNNENLLSAEVSVTKNENRDISESGSVQNNSNNIPDPSPNQNVSSGVGEEIEKMSVETGSARVLLNPENHKKEPEIQSIPTQQNSYPSPRAAFHSDKSMACVNSEIQFSPENSDIPCEFKWDFGDGEYSVESNPKHIYKYPGTYSVKLLVISSIDKKSDVLLIKDMITINPSPVPEFNWKFSSDNSDINFESAQDDIVEWKWDFGDKQISTDQKPSHLFRKKGNYNVSVSMKNNYGCSANCKKDVIIENDFNLLAPNAFSPNGDGKNDTWLPVALLSGDYTFSLTILDKNGSVAYKTTSANFPWEGRHAKTNENVKSGDSFKWIAVVKDKNGIESNYGGVISITESLDY